MKKRALSIGMALVLGMGILTGCGKGTKNAAQAQEENYTPVKVENIKRDQLYNSVVITGKITADKDTVILPKIPGKVESVGVKVGDAVNVGTTLFTLDKTDAQNKVQQAKAGLDSASAAVEQAQVGVTSTDKGIETAKAGLESAKASYETAKASYELNNEKIQNAKLNLERVKSLYEQGIVSKAEYEQAQLAASDNSIEIFKAQLNQAEAGYNQAKKSFEQTMASSQNSNVGVKQAQAGYSQAQVGYNQAVQALNDMTVTSPISGMVSSITIEKGEMASNAQPAMTIVNMDKVYVEVSVTENLVNKLKKGSEVDVDIASIGAKEVKGKIYTISPAADSRTNLYAVKIEMDNKDHRIKPGMFGKVYFKTDFINNVIVVKSEAILVEEGKTIIYVVKDGKAHKKEVEVGMDNGKYTEIKSGIQEGEQIIVKGQQYVQNSSNVKIIDDKTPKENGVGGEK
ncbi:efflux RND transporter periplasmic adaptor subunit [Clostridium ganghwense]|uniref:Efflux RND transporter periplasmic adaptor subunit n=1 Tax=Clostridium ganghwense TaxID=312089 RepID=A0ABT4CRD4_9CLOT|nr:efflux RND transporter periplasmic adaptor subunit [Clostridium ganghwense]MCY6370993.1 efflux RND transporter periplasmic adaptor subunit [Clostridium ganghwense]